MLKLYAKAHSVRKRLRMICLLYVVVKFLFAVFSAMLGGLRGKKSMGGGTTRLQGGNHRGKKRGLRVYDGQRVPVGTLLAKQFRLDCLPGWNVSKRRLAKLSAHALNVDT